MQQKIPRKVRPEFRRLLKDYIYETDLAIVLNTTPQNIHIQKMRGFMSKRMAILAEEMTNGMFSAKLLAKKGALR